MLELPPLDESSNINISATSENTLLLTWPEKICPKQHHLIINFEQQLKNTLAHLVIETIASYNSLMIYYHFDLMSSADFTIKIKQNLQAFLKKIPAQVTNNNFSPEVVEIPVHYGEKAGWDLSLVSEKTGLSVAQVIEQHSATIYHAYALGFTPGFCYLASLKPCLHLPRRDTPRLMIPQGAVAIAEQQTAVYPSSSPAGWHIIGQTPKAMYQVENQNFQATISVGQQVKFTPISLPEFHQLGGTLIKEGQ
jgi:KipI family sensor histidine kinase inhibitor